MTYPLLPIGPPSLRVEVRDANLVRIGVAADMLRLDFVQTFNAVGRWQLDLPPTSVMIPHLMTPGAGILVIREDTGDVVFSGSMDSPTETFQADTGGFTFQGRDDNGFLADRLALPNPVTPLQPSYAGRVAADGVYYEYRFYEVTGQGAFDTGPSASVGTYLTNGAAAAVDTWTKGGSPIAADSSVGLTTLYFGTTGSMRHSFAGLLGHALSVEMWFFVGWDGGDGVTHGFWQNHDDSVIDPPNGVSLFKHLNNTWFWRVVDVAGGQHDVNVSASSGVGHIVPNTWNHVVGTFDATGSALYLNGVLLGQIGPFTVPTAGVPAGGNVARVGWGYAAPTGGYLTHYAVYGVRLNAAQVLAHYTGATAVTTAFDTRTGSAEDVMRAFADVNAGATAVAERRIPGFLLGAYNSITGPVITESARYANLMDLLRGLAIKGGIGNIPLAFRLQQVIGAPSHLVFDIHQPRDLTARVIYSPNLQNIVSYVRKGPVAPAANYVYVGGSGLLEDRVIVGGQDVASVALWGRREIFRDSRSTADPVALAATVAIELTKGAGAEDLTLQPLSVSGLIYGVDYGLGDKVSVVTQSGTLLQEVVFEVETTIDDTGMKVLPRVGPPAALDPLAGQGDLETIDQRLAKLEAQ